ncbi:MULTISPECIES: TetR/AcrR family transcriptional regulator [unclassified Mycolicibacterium]|uniref:TetR/AcrR family transcriptional regulator n=1 Tax=unclassified Mycolicibacterium TaxID=2636767 RepID=UPI002ED85DFF
MPRNRQQIPRAEREAAILEQAVELFAANGYRGTSVAAVGRAANVAPAAVHWYFPTKDDLFAAAVTSIFDSVRERVEADPSIGGDPYGELVALLADAQSYRGLHREAYERMEESEPIRTAYEHVQSWLDERLLAAIAERNPGGVDTELIADTAHVLFEGMLISSRRLDRSAGELIGLVFDSLTAVAAAKREL